MQKLLKNHSFDGRLIAMDMSYDEHIPQVFPEASRIQPFSPQLVPQEFLIFQLPSIMPTSRTAWLGLFPQLLKNPDLQKVQLAASTPIETGPFWIKSTNLLHPMKLEKTQSSTLKPPPFIMQDCSFPTQGYYSLVLNPQSCTYTKAELTYPPLHPLLPYLRVQSTNCCSERLTNYPLEAIMDYRSAVNEKAQLELQLPWSFIGETMPLEVQSTFPIDLQSGMIQWSTLDLSGLRYWV